MFTGLVECQGRVIEYCSDKPVSRLRIESPLTNLQLGESISVNGVCLTVVPDHDGQLIHLIFDISPETVQRTNLSRLQFGAFVNLERAMLAQARFGGHYVTGHVDKTARIDEIERLDDCQRVVLGGFEEQDMAYFLPKGSVTVDGVSLTINAVDLGQKQIDVMLVPHTCSVTTLGRCQVNDVVNIEFDYITRVVTHQIRLGHDKRV